MNANAGLITIHPDDHISEISLLLMAKNDQRAVAVGTAIMIGANNWRTNGNRLDTVIAVTAQHCLNNLPKAFGVPYPRPAWPGAEGQSVVPTWVLCGGQNVRGKQALWRCIWASYGSDDLALLYLKPANEVAHEYRLLPPLICFGNPQLNDTLWGFGHGLCREIEEPAFDFETTPRFAWGRVTQLLDDTSRSERILTNMPTEDGMSGGGVIWAKMLLGIISSTMNVQGFHEPITSITRLRQIVNMSITDAPPIDGQQYETIKSLASPGIVNLLRIDEGKQSEVVAADRFAIETLATVLADAPVQPQ